MKLLTICYTVIKLAIYPVFCAVVSVVIYSLYKNGIPDLISLAYSGETTNILI